MGETQLVIFIVAVIVLVGAYLVINAIHEKRKRAKVILAIIKKAMDDSDETDQKGDDFHDEMHKAIKKQDGVELSEHRKLFVLEKVENHPDCDKGFLIEHEHGWSFYPRDEAKKVKEALEGFDL